MLDHGHMRVGYLSEVFDPKTGALRFLKGRLGSFEVRAYRNRRPGEPTYSLTIGLRPRLERASDERIAEELP